MLQLDYLADWPLSGAGVERRGTVLVSLTQDCCALTALAAGGRLRLVDRRHRQGWVVFRKHLGRYMGRDKEVFWAKTGLKSKLYQTFPIFLIFSHRMLAIFYEMGVYEIYFSYEVSSPVA